MLQTIQEEDRAKEVKNLDLDQSSLPMERALGMHWDVETDKFGFQIRIKDKPATRRGILSVVSSVFDPLGLVAPAILPPKMLLQNSAGMKRYQPKDGGVGRNGLRICLGWRKASQSAAV